MPDTGKMLNYLDRALSDDYLFDQLRELVGDTRQAANRIRRRGVQDERAQRNVRQAATALLRAAREARRPKPKPRRGGRRMVMLAGAGAAAVYGASRARSTSPPRRSTA